jgi:uncharacterized LabA/DUF88 family protein
MDVQNLYHSAKNLFKARVNFDNMIKRALNDRQLVRIFAYVAKSDGIDPERETPTGESAFFDALENIGVDLRMKDLQIYADGAKKADWDVGIAVDAIRMAPAVDVVVLATGDGDFIPLVQYLQNLGKRVEVIAFARSASLKLKEAVDEFTDLGENPRQFLLHH